jgi:orotidine-5'-phosphate decarboxylase
MTSHLNTYEERTKNFSNPTARSLLEIMSRKKTNLCVSVDVTTKASLLRIADAAGPSVCVVKASIYTLNQFTITNITEIDVIDSYRHRRRLRSRPHR